MNNNNVVKLLLAFICNDEKIIRGQKQVVQINQLMVLNIGESIEPSIEYISMKSIYYNNYKIVGLDSNLYRKEIYTDLSDCNSTTIYIDNGNSFTFHYTIPKIIKGKSNDIDNKNIKLCFIKSLGCMFDLILYCDLKDANVTPIFERYCMTDGKDMSSLLELTKYEINIYNEDKNTIDLILKSLLYEYNYNVYDQVGNVYDQVGYVDISACNKIYPIPLNLSVIYIYGYNKQSDFKISISPEVRCIVESNGFSFVSQQIEILVCCNYNSEAKIFFESGKIAQKYPDGMCINNLKTEPSIKSEFLKS